MLQRMQTQQAILITPSNLGFIDSLREDKRITSIAIRPKSNSMSKNPNALRVSDLLGTDAYTVEPWNGLHQLTFPAGNLEVVMTIQPDADILDIADSIIPHLESVVKSG